jgi:catechol 2,3-dioxygenase-like lactoylglutathione lyase family enzyme
MTETHPPFGLIGLDHVVFLVDDMPLALDFYCRVLGCQPGYSYPRLGMEQVWCGPSLIVLWDTTHPGATGATPPVAGGRNVDHVCLNLTPIDVPDLVAYLNSHNVRIEHTAFHGGARGMGNSVYVLDPFGNKLELKGPPVYPDGRELPSGPPAAND